MKKLAIMLLDGTTISVDFANDGEFPAFVTSVRLAGYIMLPGLYIPGDKIKMLLLVDGGQPPANVTVEGMTKQ